MLARLVFGIASLGFGLWGLIDPPSLANVMGTSDRFARFVGVRDTAISAVILVRGGPAGYVLRAVADGIDVVATARSGPAVWGTAAVSGTVAVRTAARSAVRR